MVNRLNRCASNLTTTPTSSCTEYLSHPCQDRCNNERCQRSCYFINDHTYTILKKICRRMIKDYGRTQCREKYKIFDGGNSINVRIHRSDSQGYRTWRQEDKSSEKNQRCPSVPTDPSRSRYQEEEADKAKLKQQRSRSEKVSRVGGKFYADNDASFRPKDRGKYRKSDVNDAESHRRKGQTSKHRDDVDDVSYRNDNKVKRKSSTGGGKYDVDNDERRTKGKANGSKKGGKGKYGDNDYDDKEQREKTKRNKSGSINNDNKDKNDNDMDKTGKRRKEKTSKQHEDDDDRGDKKRTGKMEKIKSNDNKNDTRKKGHKAKGDDADNDEERKIKGKKNSKSKSNNEDDADDEKTRKMGKTNKNRTSIYSSDRVINDLRKKVRNGDKVGPHDGRLLKKKLEFLEERGKKKLAGKNVRLTKLEAEALQYRRLKSTRADEAKACDYLRANMEQRDLCQLVCAPRPCPSQPFACNPCPRMHCTCPTPCFPCCPDIFCKS